MKKTIPLEEFTQEQRLIIERVGPIIEAAGFQYGEMVNIVEEGISFHYIREYNGKKIHFYWYFDRDFGPLYFVGRMSTGRKVNPEEKFRASLAYFEIFDIVERELNQLDDFTEMLFAAWNTFDMVNKHRLGR